MDKDRVATILDDIGVLLALRGENQFRCQAYHAAARALLQLEGDFVQIVATGELTSIPGIGATLEEKITVLVTTGCLPFYDKLKAETPLGLVEMLRLPGMGPKKIRALYDLLRIENLDQLRQACEQGKIAELKGFGAKTQQKILEGLE